MPPPHYLPEQLTSFIGREEEITTVKHLLSTSRLVTLTGTGGCGKTRLALRVAHDLLSFYRDGVWFVGLAAINDAELVPWAVASTLGLKEAQDSDPITRLADYLRSLELLLILDNCEHLAHACASLAGTLLRECPNLRILATSRQTLGTRGEVAWRVPSLSLPEEGKAYPVEDLGRYEAVALFVERARLRRYEFRLAPENAGWVARLCRRLDGIPLAIELAAARANVLSVRQIVEHLDDRFRLLKGEEGAVPPRHQTLQALVDWSYDLLSEAEKAMLRSVSVFVGGFTLQALEAVWGGEVDEIEIIDMVSQLIGKSLVSMEPGPQDERGEGARYHLLETIRQYAWQKLGESGEMEVLRNRHLAWFLQLAREAQPELRGQEADLWLQRLEQEHDNFRAALRWSAESEKVEELAQLTLALWTFWYLRTHLRDARRWLGKALERREQMPAALRADLLNTGGILGDTVADYKLARSLMEESLAIRRELGDIGRLAVGLHSAGFMAYRMGDYHAACSLIEESVGLLNTVGNHSGLAMALKNLGMVASLLGDYERAHSLHAEALAIREELGDKSGIALTLLSEGGTWYSQGDYPQAKAYFEKSLAIYRDLGDHNNVPFCLANLGKIALKEGDSVQAERLFRESLELHHGYKLEWTEGLAIYLGGLAAVAARQGQWERAARLFGASRALFDSIPGSPSQELEEYESEMADARAQLGEVDWSLAWNEGRAMSPEQVIQFAAQGVMPEAGRQGIDRRSATESYADHLTEREVDVLRLVAAGLTNVEIGARLVLSPRTVQAHLRSIYSRLGISSRSAATRYAIEHGLA